MPLPLRNGVANTAPYVINDPAVPQPATYAVFMQGGYHALDFLNDGTENSLYGIKRHHRAWDMLVAIKQNRITYKLVDGHFNSDLMDNRNWKVWKDDNQSTNITGSGGLSPWSAQEAAAGEYDTDEFVGHNGTIWRSTVDNNLSEPGTDASWEESSLDRLAHQRNKDTGLMTSTGVFFSLDQVLDLINARIAKTALDTDIALDNSDEKVATSKAVKSYVDSLIAGAVRNPKPFDASTATTFPVGVAGDTYRVTAPGTVQGVKLQAGDLLFTDKPNAGAVAGDWYTIQSNVDQATQAVIGLLRLATEAETVAETLLDVAVSPFTLGRWFGNVLTRSGLFFREVVAVLGLQLGSLTTAGSTRTIEAKGSQADVSIELKVQGNGKLRTNALIHAGTDSVVAAGTDGTLKDTGINPAKLSVIADLGRTAFVSPLGDNATAQVGRVDKPYATIQAAISANPGGAVLVLAGTYTESVSAPDPAPVTLLLMGPVVLNGNVSGGGELHIRGIGYTVINGLINAPLLYIKGITKIATTSQYSVFAMIYAGNRLQIEDVDEITASHGSMPILRAENGPLNNPSLVRNVRLLRNTGPVSYAVRNLRLENIGLLESTTTSIDSGESFNVKAFNCHFRSVGLNYSLTDHFFEFENCRLESLTTRNLTWYDNPYPNARLVLKNCKLKAETTYHIGTSANGKQLGTIHVHGCECSGTDILDSAANPVTNYDEGYNSTGVALTF